MAEDEKAESTLGEPKAIDLKVVFDDGAKPNINSIHDTVMLQMLEDSANENDEPLRLIEKRIWDPSTKIAEFDVSDSAILELMFGKQAKK